MKKRVSVFELLASLPGAQKSDDGKTISFRTHLGQPAGLPLDPLLSTENVTIPEAMPKMVLNEYGDFEFEDKKTKKFTDKTVAHVKFYTPNDTWVWYGTFFEKKNGNFFGFVIGPSPEAGHFCLEDLQRPTPWYRGPVVQDLNFEPISIEEIKALHGVD